MTIVKLRDNRNRQFQKSADGMSYIARVEEGLPESSVSAKEKELLEKYSGEAGALKNLTETSKGAIVDLSNLGHLATTDRGDLRFIQYISGADGGFSFKTENLMGVLRFRDLRINAAVQIEVLSRFDQGKNNFFLNYLLSRVFDFAQGVEAVSAQRSSLLEILLDVIFVRRLGEAAREGILRHYREFRNNDWNFKGSLDLPRHIRENVPLMHGIAYRKREIDLDVPVNRMILAAALVANRRNPSLFESNAEAADALRQLRMGVTEAHDIRSLLAHRDCREPVVHPFFREVWEPLRRIARMILEFERWTLFSEGADDEEVSGIVFDGSWLWEEYVATVLKRKGFCHSGHKDGTVEKILPVFKDGSRRFAPDFYLRHEASDGYDCVLDAKYKRSNPNGARCDVHQVLCYLLLTGARLGGLVFPPVDYKCEMESDQDKEAYGNYNGWSPPRAIASPYSAVGHEVQWSCFSWASVPPEVDTWDNFCGYMKEQEKGLLGMQSFLNGGGGKMGVVGER